LLTGVAGAAEPPAEPAAGSAGAPVGATTAWHNGAFHVDTAAVVSRSDIVLGQPNPQPSQSMPLGNGTLGAAVWAADGFTAQLNRNDTMPDRKSPGQVVIPGLSQLTGASDYRGRVNLYDAQFQESGGSMTATTYMRADKDELVVDVTGADPRTAQTARIQLWDPRTPTAVAAGALGTLAETWTDTRGSGATGKIFGTLAGITAGGRDVTASVVDTRTVQVRFRPYQNGSFRIVVAAPSWTGGDAQATAGELIGSDATTDTTRLRAAHLAWWHDFWGRAGLIQADSADQVADYMENLRTIYLYQEAASSRAESPGSQAGVADLFSWNKDAFYWDASAYWHWNLRMMTAANIGAGAFDLNAPYFRLYRDNLAAIEDWTKAHMGGRDGICIPETMRFNGVGYENETWLSGARPNCDAAYAPYYNARTITTGAEVGLWVWQQYQWTQDQDFLEANYPLMAEAAKFLLAYATVGTDGRLHTYPSNAHETQWDVHDPTTDIAAERALFPAVIAAAQHLGRDADLVAKLQAALPELLPFPTTGTGTGQVIAPSYDPNATKHNSENIGLEPVWPYELIGDQGPDSTLAQQTFINRPYSLSNDWSFDPVDAAMLGLGDQLPDLLSGLVGKFQVYPDGMAVVASNFTGQQPYSEMSGIVALTLNQALVTDENGEIRVAAGWPSTWDGAGTEYVHGRSKVDVQIRQGVATTVAIEAGTTGTLRVRNPWPGRQVQVVDGTDEHRVVVASSRAADLDIPVTAGQSYLLERVAAPTNTQAYSPVSGSAATEYKRLGSRTIGLPDQRPAQTAHTVSFDGHSFLIDGKRVFMWSGEFHYFRLPNPDLWRDVLEKMKAAGFNAVSIYFDWAYHSPRPGVYDFTGVRDVDKLLDIADQVGLYVIARPGPYINGEVDSGGLPGWVDTQKGHSRSTAPDYLSAALDWQRHIDAILARHQLTNGTGSVILYQIENEYCFAGTSAGLDASYMQALEAQADADGISVPQFHNSCYPSGATWSSGAGKVDVTAWDAYPNGFSCTNAAGWHAIPDYSNARAMTPANEPLYMAEFQGGSFDPWGGPGYDKCRQMDNGDFERIISQDAIASGFTGQNFYMEYGGTNWGWQQDTLTQGYTSYDYGAAITEGRQLTDKYYDVKALGYFTQTVQPLRDTDPAPSPDHTNASAVAVDERINPATHTEFLVVHHADRTATSTDATTITLTGADGTYQIPQQQGAAITLAGRDSKLLLAGYDMDGQHLVYSTSELMTHLQTGDRDVAVLYGRSGQDGETVLRYASQPTVTVLAGQATSTWDAGQGGLRLNYTHGALTRILIQGGGRPDLLLLVGDDAAVRNLWQLDTGAGPALILGPSLARTATATGARLTLTGDTDNPGSLEVFAAPYLTQLTWNDHPVPAQRTASGSLLASRDGPQPVPLPALTSWKYQAESPEAQPGFDDSTWAYADHLTTNNPTRPGTLPVLYADDYGFHYGDVWYRGHFTATGTESGLSLTAATGPHGAYAAWLNGTYLGSSGEGAHTFAIPPGTLTAGKDNVVAVLVENMGHTEQSVRDNDANKAPRGLTAATVVGSPAVLTWKIQGARGGQTPIDPVRGPMNNGGLYGERAGWSLPGYPDGDWQAVTLPHSDPAPGVAWYRTQAQLDVAPGQDVSLGLTITDQQPRNYRALVFVNGWQVGHYVSNVGPQHTFVLPSGIVHLHGDNTIAIAVWSLDPGGDGLGSVALTQLGNHVSGLTVGSVAAPGYRPDVYATPSAPVTATLDTPDHPKAGSPFTATATVTAAQPVTDGTLSLHLPRGWIATPTSPTTITQLAPGQSATATWTVSVPDSQSPGTFVLGVDATFRPGSTQAERVTVITTPPLGPGTHYISDLPFLSSTNGWGPVERDMSNGGNQAGDGQTLQMHDVTYVKGLGTNSVSDVNVWLGASCTSFTAQVGIDQEVYAEATHPTQATVDFQVRADGRLVYDSGTVNKNTPTHSINADITGAQTLELFVGDAGDGNGSDHGDWANAQVHCGS
jgi:beta-galactosidase